MTANSAGRSSRQSIGAVKPLHPHVLGSWYRRILIRIRDSRKRKQRRQRLRPWISPIAASRWRAKRLIYRRKPGGRVSRSASDSTSFAMRLRPRARPTSRRSARRCAPGPIAARACPNSKGSCMNTRTPSEARPPRMEVLARLPVFYALAGKRAVVAGGTAAAAWKAELLIAAGAAVDVYAPETSEELVELVANTPLIML